MPFISTLATASAKGYGFTAASATVLTIGQAYEGGFYAGQLSTSADGVATHNLVVAPKSSGQSTKEWKNVNTVATGADSVVDGPQNTADMVADGSSTVYPAAHFCNDLTVGSFTDWYMPARNEIEICYYNLKPTTANNATNTGTNDNSVPKRTTNYTTGTPAQTSAAAFQTGGAEAWDANVYWSSTESGTVYGSAKYFSSGAVVNRGKNNSLRVRAIRRVAI